MSVFTGDVNKLVAAAMLQDYLVDKDGTPMSSGTVTMYHDNSRTTLKNWYYQSGTPGNYTYITLPNPLTLSAAGTICDINGVDTIPFYYPWSETDEDVHDPYYVTIVNHAMTNQITRANFPFEGEGGGGGGGVDTFNNLIINNGFWRNIAPNTLNVTPFTQYTYSATNMTLNPAGNLYTITVAPSQHDGFRYPDIEFQKNNQSATDKVTFVPFPSGLSLLIANTSTPEYYINHVCNSPGTGETQKCYSFPISLHLNTLANLPFTFTIQAQNDVQTGVTTGAGNVINIYIYQDTGTGGTPVAVGIPLLQINLNSTWSVYTASGVFPSTAGLTLGQGADDAFYLQVQMPLNVGCGINFTKPSIYISETGVVPTTDLQTYDQVDAIINSPRTGDLRTSINNFYNYGWLPMNDGTIGIGSSMSNNRSNADTWPLFNLIWTIAAPYSASGAGTTNPLAQMYTTGPTFTPVGYGPNISSPTTAYGDFTAGRQLSLSKMMGRVIMGSVPLSALLPPNSQTVTSAQLTATFTAAPGASGLLLTSTLPMAFGEQVQVSNSGGGLPGGLSAATTYFAAPASASTFYLATSLANAQAGTFIAYSSAGTGTQSVQTFALVFTSATAMNLFKGDPVTFTNTSGSMSPGTLPTGITANTIYYANPISTTTFVIATSFANAINGNYILYAGAGVAPNTVYSQIPISTLGEYDHMQLGVEVGTHKHFSSSGGGFYEDSTSANVVTGPGAFLPLLTTTTTGLNTGSGGQATSNIIQSATFYNMYIKL
jgi:hypothetical protein